MKKLLILVLLASSITASAQITDTGILRNYVNANIVPNSARQVTGTQMNTILNGMLNVMQKYNSAAGYANVKNISYDGPNKLVTYHGKQYNHFVDTSLKNKTILAFSDIIIGLNQIDNLDSVYSGSQPRYPCSFYYEPNTGEFYTPYFYDTLYPLIFSIVYNNPISNTQATSLPSDIQLKIGTTAGAPADGTNTYSNNDLKNRRIRLYLNGAKLPDFASTGRYYSFNSAAGTITMAASSGSPNFINGDLLQIEFY